MPARQVDDGARERVLIGTAPWDLELGGAILAQIAPGEGSVRRTCSTQARGRKGLRGIPKPFPVGSGCPGPDPTPPGASVRSRAPGSSEVWPDRSASRRIDATKDSRSARRLPTFGGSFRPFSLRKPHLGFPRHSGNLFRRVALPARSVLQSPGSKQARSSRSTWTTS